MKKYSGQAIAIIMVILVVAAVIGASLYSRMIRNKGEVIDTRESSKALEQSGNILDAFITTDIRDLQTALSSQLVGPDYKITIETTSTTDPIGQLKGLITDAFPGLELDLSALGGIDASCSKYKTTVEYADPSIGPEYNVGDVMAINLSGLTSYPPPDCKITLTFPSRAGERLFAEKLVYKNPTGGYKPYELSDMRLYCLSATCPTVSPSSSLESWGKTERVYTLSNPNLQEIRIIPLKGTMEIGVSGSDTCGKIFHQFLIKATSICSGQERTMQVIIPSATNYGYDPMFDYTIYNSNGALNPVVL